MIVWDNPKPRVKQPKVSQLPPPPAAPPAPRGPRYRYFSTPPEQIALRLGDVAATIPAGVRAPAFDQDRVVEVPCAAILNGPVPKISLTTLAELAPDCFASRNFSETWIRLPASRLALAYRMIFGSELIEEPAPETPEPEAFAPMEEPVAVPEEEPLPPPAPPVGEKPPVVPPVPSPVAELAPSPVESQAAEPTPEAPPAVPPQSIGTEPPIANPPQPKRAFSLLPIFRRKETQPVEPSAPAAPAPAEPRPRVAIPKPRPPSAPLMPPVSAPPAPEPVTVPLSIPPLEEPAPISIAEQAAVLDEPPAPPPEPPPAPPEPAAPVRAHRSEAVLIETEHLPKTGSKARKEIPDQDGLQAIFLTEETLGLDRVIELCGDLPGVRSCVLSHGTAVLASHKVPDSLDLVSLSAHAVEMLDAMRASSAKMGIGAVPAVTVHSAKGPITFFNQEDLCLLVLHKDRGFVPGVREKLQQVIEELSRANLPLPMPQARPSLES